jgi:hypothetical protein
MKSEVLFGRKIGLTAYNVRNTFAPSGEVDLRRAMRRAGKCETAIDWALDALRPVVLAVERAGTRVDCDVAWALLAVAADRQRRQAHATRRAW